MIKIENQKICIIVSIYNKDITFNTLKLAKTALSEENINKIDILKVPGAFEIPVAISKLIKKYDGFIAIGCVIKGETNNFDLICKSITDGIMRLSIDNSKPIGNALITVFNKSQAEKRLKKGYAAARAVIDVLKNGPEKI